MATSCQAARCQQQPRMHQIPHSCSPSLSRPHLPSPSLMISFHQADHRLGYMRASQQQKLCSKLLQALLQLRQTSCTAPVSLSCRR